MTIGELKKTLDLAGQVIGFDKEVMVTEDSTHSEYFTRSWNIKPEEFVLLVEYTERD